MDKHLYIDIFYRLKQWMKLVLEADLEKELECLKNELLKINAGTCNVCFKSHDAQRRTLTHSNR